MSTLKIAANLIEAISPAGLGHLQIVRERDDGYQEEIEVQAPFWLTLGNFTYPAVRDHTLPANTSNYGVDYEYNAVELDIGNRSADEVWDLLVSVHLQFQALGQGIEYDIYQNSNSYATTLLNIIGLDFFDYFTAVRPFAISSFPGAGLNLLDSEVTAIDLQLAGADGKDIIRTGVGNDTLTGGKGEDDLRAGGGIDTLFGGVMLVGENPADPQYIDDKVGDYLSGGAGEDTFIIVASDDNYSNSLRDPYWGSALTARAAAWYALSLKYIDTIHDEDSSGTISVEWTFGYQTYNVNLGFDFYEGFVSENFDPRGGFLYNDTNPNGNWQINTGPTTGVYMTQMRNHDGGFSDYVIVQGGYGALGVETHNPVFAIELGAINTQQRTTLGSKVLEIGDASDDTLIGGSDDDQLFGEAGNDTITGDAGSDYIEGGDGEDYLDGGEGDDVLLGDSGDDTILGGEGDDIIYGESGADVLYGGDGNDTLVVDADDSVIDGGNGYDLLVFSGSEDFIFSMAGTGIEEVQSGSGDDLITGSDETDVIWDGAGDDIVHAGLGDDDLYIGTGNNVIDGGDGDDYVTFENERSYYSFSLVGGDVICFDGEFTNTLRNIEHFYFVDGVFSLTDLLTNQIAGTPSDDLLAGTPGDDTINGKAGDDYMNGSSGSDTYLYASGDGNDTISDEAIELGDIDVLKFTDLNIGDLTISRSGEDMLITVNATGDVITVKTQYYNAYEGWALERLDFADGTSLELDHSPDTTWIYGSAGAGAIDGTWGKDYIIGGLGDDVMNGGAGGDVYIYAKGDESDTINDDVGFLDNLDVLRFTDLTLNDLSFWRVDEALFIGVKGTSDVITVATQYYNAYEGWALERLDFADGTSMTLDHSPDTTWITGTAGADILDGTWGKDYFIGGLGDDVFNGSAGGDVYIYASGDGNDIINDGVGFADNVDILRFTDLSEDDLTFVKDGGDFKITVAGTGQVITVQDQFHVDDPYWGVDRIEFADGKSWGLDQILEAVSIRGTAGNDNLVGTSSFDTIVGGAGDDQLQGNDGSDTFVFRANFGHDTITDFVAGEGTDDVIDVSTDIFADFAAVMAAATQVGTDALITHDANNSILLKNVALANLHQDDFRFTSAA